LRQLAKCLDADPQSAIFSHRQSKDLSDCTGAFRVATGERFLAIRDREACLACDRRKDQLPGKLRAQRLFLYGQSFWRPKELVQKRIGYCLSNQDSVLR